ncbi:MAG: hypothetical protein IE916_00110 [Epsilonproteobacteria bacterium]|nr:hypothetical protein [Campylobacterota bacterium]
MSKGQTQELSNDEKKWLGGAISALHYKSLEEKKAVLGTAKIKFLVWLVEKNRTKDGVPKSVEGIKNALDDEDIVIAYGTVSNTMRFLCELGYAEKVAESGKGNKNERYSLVGIK